MELFISLIVIGNSGYMNLCMCLKCIELYTHQNKKLILLCNNLGNQNVKLKDNLEL